MNKLFKAKFMFKHNMGFKTITIKESAYNRLKAAKKRNESFSEFFERTIPQQKNLTSFAGSISDVEAKTILKNIARDRKRADCDEKKRLRHVLS